METLEYAKRYLSEGISVLPVRPFEKRPYMNNWHNYMKFRPVEDELEKWFKALSGAGVGAVTGSISNIIVLDIDTRFQGNVDDILNKYPTNRVSQSGSGGYHLFYRYPQGVGRIGNAVNLIEGVDLRADGGFIVLPPTIHPTGNKYKWINEGDMGTFPLDLLKNRKDRSDENSETWLKETLKGVMSGGRNNAAAKLAGYFFSKSLNFDVVSGILTDWNMKNDPPLNQEELMTTINSVYKLNTRNAPSCILSEEKEGKKLAGAFDLMTLKGYFHEFNIEGTSWLVDEWLPMNSIAFMISPPESYKTWLLLDLAVSVASGLPFLGKFEVNRPGPVLLIQQEDSHSGIIERLSLIIQNRMNLLMKAGNQEWEVFTLPDLPIYVHADRNLKFSDKTVMDRFEEQIAKIRPSIVLIDPLYSTVSTDNYMAAAAEDMMRLKGIRDKYGCSFVIAHHSKKNVDPDSTAREDAWGSQFLNAFLEAGWQIRRSNKLEQNEVVVRRHSKTMGNFVPMILKFNISTHGDMVYEVSTNNYMGTSGGAEHADNDIIKLLITARKPMSQTEISEVLGKSRSTISRQVKKLQTANVISILKDGKLVPIIKENEDE